jgi:RNA polymerase sigma-70 factor (ECF subfamily)
MMENRVGDPRQQDVQAAWHAHRQRSFDVAYRMLGTVSEAEDVVQEAYLRLLQTGTDEIDDLRAWLTTVTAHLCLDLMRSARARRTSYVGPWLPEPLVRHEGPMAAEDRVTLDDSVRLALLAVLDTLSPAERTAFVLHDVFQVPFQEIAALVGRSPAACRQLASRARARIAEGTRGDRLLAGGSELRQVAEAFVVACSTGRFDLLLQILDPGVVGSFDSGGHVPGAPTGPIAGRDRVLRVIRRSFAETAASFAVAEVNGEPGVVVRLGGRVVAVVALTVVAGRIRHLDAVGNPEKLGHLR